LAGRRRGGIGDPIDPEIPLEPPKPASMAPYRIDRSRTGVSLEAIRVGHSEFLEGIRISLL
jgi:hypothetical protein